VAPIIERIGSGCASNPMRVLIRLTAPAEAVQAQMSESPTVVLSLLCALLRMRAYA
jgi:hypothetical protein